MVPTNSKQNNIDFTWKIGGEAGFGIASAGLIFAKTMNRLHYFLYGYLEYPSLIRGGHNVYEVHVSDRPVFSQEKQVDILVCLNQETFTLHQRELKKGAVVIFDPEKTKIAENSANYFLYPVPVAKMVKELNGLPVMENNLFLSVSLALVNAEEKIIKEIVAEIFATKGEKVIKQNQQIIHAGYEFVAKNSLKNFSINLTNLTPNNSFIMTGNEAVALGAIAADCRIYAAYPMTPATSILHVLAQYAKQSQMVVKHVGDEIEAINLIIGAAFAGVRAMTGTSGGGFALMNEGLGLAGVTESAIVIANSQRPGPATGLPTWTGQGDLQYIIHAAQDEFLRIVLAPGDVEEAFYLTQEAFNLADLYQTPVFILLDKYLSEGLMTGLNLDDQKVKIKRGKLLSQKELDKQKKYLRYQVTLDGISPRAVAGQKNGVHLANSYEHNEYGLSTEEAKEIIAQRDKRNRKMQTYLQKDFQLPQVFGSEKANLTIVAWGSSKGPVLEAMKELGDEVNFYHFHHVFPLDAQKVRDLLRKTQKTLLIEGNGTGQLGLLLREQTGWQPTAKMFKYDGRPFYPEEIIDKVKSL